MISSLVVALVTPFNSRGVVDWGALGEYLEFLSERRVRDVLVGGTTGEFASLTLDERRHLLEFCRSRWSGALIAHVGSSCLTDAVALSDHAQDHADVIAAMPPYFFAHPPEAGVLEYFRALGHRSVRPLLLYNFPMHTQARISAEMVEVLARDLPNLLGMKDSDKDHALSKRYKSGNSALRVFLGDDSAAAMYAILAVTAL
ncbi:MAG: dihydrodipicolinate synthase family protein [Micrococcales bacterium]|nr:dihydrodipicolinate synthase family protein [Micrococcales bacterium]